MDSHVRITSHTHILDIFVFVFLFTWLLFSLITLDWIVMEYKYCIGLECIILYWIELNWIELGRNRLHWMGLVFYLIRIELHWLGRGISRMMTDCIELGLSFVSFTLRWVGYFLDCDGLDWIQLVFCLLWVRLGCVGLGWVGFGWIFLSYRLDWIILFELSWVGLCWVGLFLESNNYVDFWFISVDMECRFCNTGRNEVMTSSLNAVL